MPYQIQQYIFNGVREVYNIIDFYNDYNDKSIGFNPK